MLTVAGKHPTLSLADAIQLAGIAAVEAAGGPAITFAPGRRDSWAHAPEGRLFDPRGVADPAAALAAFAARLGMSLRHVVALAAVHSLARWWPGPPVDGGRRGARPRFSNAFFRGVLSGAAPGDAWLLADAETRLLVQEYADNEAALVCDYAAAHEELSRLGPRPRPAPPPAPEVGVVALAVGVGVAVAVVAAGVVAVAAWRRRRRRRVL